MYLYYYSYNVTKITVWILIFRIVPFAVRKRFMKTHCDYVLQIFVGCNNRCPQCISRGFWLRALIRLTSLQRGRKKSNAALTLSSGAQYSASKRVYSVSLRQFHLRRHVVQSLDASFSARCSTISVRRVRRCRRRLSLLLRILASVDAQAIAWWLAGRLHFAHAHCTSPVGSRKDYHAMPRRG